MYLSLFHSLNLIDYKVNAKNTKLIFSAATAIKVEPSSRKTSIKNVAIQVKKMVPKMQVI